MNQLYQVIGISKQAVYQYARRQAAFDQRVIQLIAEADALRRDHPGCGVEKMYHILKPDFIGRDRFVALFMDLGYRLKRKKNYRRTTIASQIYYPNLIPGMEITAPSVLWQSDITYIRIGEKFYYAVFILDVYTRKIVGYQVSDHLRASANVKALRMALRNHLPPQIHHSDRGSQYIYKEYVALLKENDCAISMAGSAQENAYAERIHRTIKEEYLDYWKPKNFGQLKKGIAKAVKNYNQKRAHKSLGKLSPIQFEDLWSFKGENASPVMTIFDPLSYSKTGQH